MQAERHATVYGKAPIDPAARLTCSGVIGFTTIVEAGGVLCGQQRWHTTRRRMVGAVNRILSCLLVKRPIRTRQAMPYASAVQWLCKLNLVWPRVPTLSLVHVYLSAGTELSYMSKPHCAISPAPSALWLQPCRFVLPRHHQVSAAIGYQGFASGDIESH